MIPIAFEVSIDEPPPIARIKSAPDFAKASTPAFTLLTVGFGLISLNISYGIPAFSNTFNTLSATPNLIKSLSVATKALLQAQTFNPLVEALHAHPGRSKILRLIRIC